MKPDDFIQKAIELAEFGRGKTSPNPFVGAVIVKNGEVIGKGFTQPCGSDHAEVQALKSAGRSARGATMYVTLEPCCFQGRTPPCTAAIIKAGIAKVCIGIKDPDHRVNGKGIAILRESGIEVETGFQAEKIKKQLEIYLLWKIKKRPFVFLKSAITLDGYIADSKGGSKWITGKEARNRVHKIRSRVDAIISGIGTVLSDNPVFNCRLPGQTRQPWRIIMDRELRIPIDSNIVSGGETQKTIIFCNRDCDRDKMEKLREKLIEVISFDVVNPETVIDWLSKKNVTSILVEAGREINSSFVMSGFVDKYYIFLAPSILGNGIKIFNLPGNKKLSQKITLSYYDMEMLGSDCLLTAYPVK